MKRLLQPLALASVLLHATLVAAQQVPGVARDFRLEGTPVSDLQNSQPNFQLRLSANRTDCTYEEGEEFVLHVQASEACNVFLFNVNPRGKVTLLFPNDVDANSRIPAGTKVDVGGPDFGKRFVARPEFGSEEMVVVASRKPLSVQDQAIAARLIREALASSDVQRQQRGVKDFVAETRRRSNPGDWQVRHLRVVTTPRHGRAAVGVRQPRRFFVGVGLSKYLDDRISNLKAPHRDVRRAEEWFRKTGDYEIVASLADEQATFAAVKKIFEQDLPDRVRPGDSVVVYWSGHGGRTADKNGDETDGQDEYLVVHDSAYLRPETMILDDLFFEWTNRLNLCDLTLVVDSCYSGGAAKGPGSEKIRNDFLDNEMRQAKAAGNTRSAMLAASEADQEAFELTDHSLSVMTHFLLQVLEQRPSASLAEVHREVRQSVQDYVREHQKVRQTPVLIGEHAEQMFLVQR